MLFHLASEVESREEGLVAREIRKSSRVLRGGGLPSFILPHHFPMSIPNCIHSFTSCN